MSNYHPSGRPKSGEALGVPGLCAAFQALAEARFVPKGTVLFRQGDPSQGVYLLVQGRAKLSLRADSGRQVVVRRVGPGQVLGLPATILNTPYLLTAELLEDARVIFVPSADAVEFLRAHGELCYGIVQMLGCELAEMALMVPKPEMKRRRSN